MWFLFGYYWYLVSKRGIGEDSIQALMVLSVVVVVGILGTLLWVAHNKKLARRNRRNTPAPAVPEPFDMDYLKRPIVAPDIKILQAASIIDIELAPLSEAEKKADPHNEYAGKKVYSVAKEVS